MVVVTIDGHHHADSCLSLILVFGWTFVLHEYMLKLVKHVKTPSTTQINSTTLRVNSFFNSIISRRVNSIKTEKVTIYYRNIRTQQSLWGPGAAFLGSLLLSVAQTILILVCLLLMGADRAPALFLSRSPWS